MQYRRMLFLTRPGCGLCDAALPMVTKVAHRLGVQLVVIDLAKEPDLEAEYHLRIPVLLSRDHRVLAEGTITRGRAALAALRAWF